MKVWRERGAVLLWLAAAGKEKLEESRLREREGTGRCGRRKGAL